MRVLIAPDSFKGSVSAVSAGRAIARGVVEACPDSQIDLCPLADGGEGTAEVLVHALGGELRRARVMGALGDPVEAAWAWLGPKVAVVDSASAVGLPLVPEQKRNPLRTTTYGVGELVRHALDAGVSTVLVGLGGSATTDGGTGLAQALGVTFEGGPTPMAGGALQSLRRVHRSTRDPRLDAVTVIALCDVDAPLLGPWGAARVYSPQKGASPDDVVELERGLARLAELVEPRAAALDGAGAAGGMGFGLRTLIGAELVSGTDFLFERVGLQRRLIGCDLVLTGEGRLDQQSLSGKVVGSVVREAQRAGVPVRALVGAAGPGAEEVVAAGLGGYEDLVTLAGSVEAARADPERWLTLAATRAVRAFQGQGNSP